MDNILFSSWGGKVIDNRGKCAHDVDLSDHPTLPEKFGGKKVKAMLGWNGIVVRSPDIDILELCRTYIEVLYEHAKACDKCNYCKTGWKEQLEVLDDIYSGDATEEDLEFMKSSAEAIIDAGKCTIGKSGPVPVLQALEYFAEAFSSAVKGTRSSSREPFTYHSKPTAPCMDACPLHLDVPRYIEKIKDAKFADSLASIRERLPFAGAMGRICVRPCEDHCRRANVDEAVSIRALKRFVADTELKESRVPEYPVTPSEKVGKVAVIGSGPAGTNCAFHLARKGHDVTVFEKLHVLGGMMVVGIPPFILPQAVLAKEIESIEKLGIVFKTGVCFGQDMNLLSLKQEGFDAVFISTGLHGSRRLGVSGEDLEGVIPGVQFLRDVALGKNVALNSNVVVIGGGNVAVDVARTASRLGAHPVTMVCLEAAAEMPAWQHEIQAAREEKIEIVNCLGPKRFIGENGKVTGVEFKRCTSVFDSDGCFNPQYDEKNVTVLPADTVIVSIGQVRDLDSNFGRSLALTPGGELKADPRTFQTETQWVFAGGDAVYGPKSAVEAANSGRKAAIQIDRFINNLPVEPDLDDWFDDLFKSIKVYDPTEMVKQKVEDAKRRNPSVIEPEGRMSNFDEIEQPFSTPDAVAEAERCLRCYRVVTVAL
jgi:NADPH-dependent glutamate synthase beta subunit-like oxidoreductase